jgi:hypothetical protein
MMLPSISAGPLLCNNLSYLIFNLSMLFIRIPSFPPQYKQRGKGMLKSPVGTAPLKEYYSHFFRGGRFLYSDILNWRY